MKIVLHYNFPGRMVMVDFRVKNIPADIDSQSLEDSVFFYWFTGIYCRKFVSMKTCTQFYIYENTSVPAFCNPYDDDG